MAHRMTERRRFMLAAMAADPGAGYTATQIQKFFFLLDENIADRIGGKKFRFIPHNYGPFDLKVFHELETLEEMNLVNTTPADDAGFIRSYSLTAQGKIAGKKTAEKFSVSTRIYMKDASEWVQSLSFGELIGAIYRDYPHMKENSVFAV